eukprot:scaffold59622_cov94-Phaeocystis_antarctica.AAC.1
MPHPLHHLSRRRGDSFGLAPARGDIGRKQQARANNARRLARRSSDSWYLESGQRGLRLQQRRQLPRCRVVEDQRARQRRRALAERLLQLVAQHYCAQRVEPRLHQRRVRIDRAARRARRQHQHRLERHRRRHLLKRCRGAHSHNGAHIFGVLLFDLCPQHITLHAGGQWRRRP